MVVVVGVCFVLDKDSLYPIVQRAFMLLLSYEEANQDCTAYSRTYCRWPWHYLTYCTLGCARRALRISCWPAHRCRPD
jgi:hypothetical protein